MVNVGPDSRSAKLTTIPRRHMATPAPDAIRDELVRIAQVGSSALDSYDRMLLTADGTVTTLLEACTGEPVATTTTRQTGPATLDRLLTLTGRWWHPDAALLALAPAERLIARRAILTGARSGVPYVLAESLVLPGRLPGACAEPLMHAGVSLGRLLLADALETRREVLRIVAVRAGEASDALGVASSATLARRTYRIVIRGRAAAAVTEWLPTGRLAATADR
jgi:chorismate-pyruvate lyase